MISKDRIRKLVNDVKELQETGGMGPIDYDSLLNKPDLSSLHEPGSDNQDLSDLQPKETGKVLSKNDYTDNEKSKLSSIEVNSVNLSTVKNDSEIADAINKKHNELHNHNELYEQANTNIQSHITTQHAPQNAQKNSDITKSEIEAKLTGEISSHSHAGGGGGLGYAINIMALTSSPVDAQTVYFGMLPKAPVTTANISKIYIRKAGTIKIAEIYCYSGTAGTNQAWSLYIRKNNSADTLIATLSVATNERVFSNTGLSIPVAVGDYIEIKAVNPTWTTNPLTTIFGGYIYVE